MATATKTLKSKEVVTTEVVPVYTLTLSEGEAIALYTLTQLTGGDVYRSSRMYTANIMNALDTEDTELFDKAAKKFGENFNKGIEANIWFRDIIN